MEETEENFDALIPDWKVGQTLKYKLWKRETFEYNSASTDFEKNYEIELRLLDDNIVEAYYPSSVLSPMKLMEKANPYFSQVNHVKLNTIYYEMDELFRFVEFKNFDELIHNLGEIKKELDLVVSEADREDVIDNLELMMEMPKKVKQDLLKDLDIIHDFNGTNVMDGYYFDLLEKKSTAKAVKEKLFKLIKLNLGEIDILQSDIIEGKYYQVELLKGTDTVSTWSRKDFEKMKAVFIAQDFDINNYDDITLHHQVFIYNTKNFFLDRYNHSFKIDTPSMKKKIQSTIELVDVM